MPNPNPIVFNYGGGRQTIAMAIMITKSVLPKPDIIVMADTGRENDSTWEYLHQHIQPLLAQHDMRVEIAPRELSTVDTHGHNGDVLLPVYTETGKFPAYCSGEWKRNVVDRYLRAKGIKSGTRWLGLAFDEPRRWSRHHNTTKGKWTTICPLVDLMINTDACLAIVRAAGLPEPHHSSCWMCPNKRNGEWRFIRDNYPERWQAAINMDNEFRAADQHNAVYLHHSRVPLAEADLGEKETREVARQCSLGMCFV
jgi:hypothetical protein